jgi:hypothetical protein
MVRLINLAFHTALQMLYGLSEEIDGLGIDLGEGDTSRDHAARMLVIYASKIVAIADSLQEYGDFPE